VFSQFARVGVCQNRDFLRCNICASSMICTDFESGICFKYQSTLSSEIDCVYIDSYFSYNISSPCEVQYYVYSVEA